MRHYDPRTRKLTLSELLPRASRTFQLAHQIALLGQRPLLDRLVSGGKFTTQVADTICAMSVHATTADSVQRMMEAIVNYFVISFFA